jgi:hypothetical protein
MNLIVTNDIRGVPSIAYIICNELSYFIGENGAWFFINNKKNQWIS